MKHLIKPLLTALLLLCCTVAGAADFEVDGIYYNILSFEDKTVEVTSGSNNYSAIPASVTYSSITYSVTSVGEWAFAYCDGLTSIEIPSSVTSIGDYAFYNCYNLTSIEIPSSVTSIGEWVFCSCLNLTSIEIPSSVTSIGDYAFHGCGLTSIEIPSSLTSIGERVFESCGSLTSIVVDEGNSVYDSRNNCNAIIETASNTLIAGCVKTIIPEGVTSIGSNAFSSCHYLTSIEIPSSVTSIGESAFGSCSGLTSIEIPSSVTSIGEGAFEGCSGLTSIVVDEGNTIYDSRNNCNAIIETASNTLIAGCKNTIIPEGVTSIGNSAFGVCSDLTSIEIPSSVTSIGDYAFSYCWGLTSIEIPNSVTSIGESAFESCTGLTSIEIPSSVTSISNYAFAFCTGLTSIVSHIAAEDLFAPGDYAFNGIDKDACTLYVPAGAKATYATTDGWKDFKNIAEPCGDNAYYLFNETTGTLTIFGEGAMWDYHLYGDYFAPWYWFQEQIKSVDIKSGVTAIGNYAFHGCNNLTKIEIPESVISIGNTAFSWCSRLTNIKIPSNITAIKANTFYYCKNLISVKIPENVTNIHVSAFDGCSSLESITIDANNSVYDSREGCNAIIETATNTMIQGCKNSVIHNTVTTIGDYAFYGCDGLTSITIPESVTSIGISAFSGCGLTEIYSYIPADKLFVPGNNAFYGIDKEVCTLYVSAGAKATYATTEGWKDFKNIIELKPEITINDGEAYTATEAQEFDKIIYNRTFNNTNWQAWYVPFAIDYNVLKEDFDVAEINNIHMYDTDDDGTLDSSTLEIISVKGGTLQANYPYFIRAKESGKKSIAVENTTLEAAQSNYIDCSSVKFMYYFIGTTTGVSGSEMYNNNYYAMSGGSMKYAQDENVSLKPFRWYMKVEARSGAALPKEVRIRHIDDITNVEEIEAVAEDNIYYDLSGRRVENPTKGIYILNGKKVFVK